MQSKATLTGLHYLFVSHNCVYGRGWVGWDCIRVRIKASIWDKVRIRVIVSFMVRVRINRSIKVCIIVSITVRIMIEVWIR